VTSYGWRLRNRAGSEVEPFTSAKNTVTCLRSPSEGRSRGEDLLGEQVPDHHVQIDVTFLKFIGINGKVTQAPLLLALT
jgi:hypothetical protein